jgi:D-alanyl-lipoteichoic acid acyltransferase DltB (MBOAT superfamily)
MNEQQVEEHEAPKLSERQQEPRQDWGRQTIGSLIGGAIGLLLSVAMQQVGWGGENVLAFVLWGAAIGAMFSKIDALESAGRRLTRRDARWLNVGVSILGMIVIFAVIIGFAQLVGVIIRYFTGS